MSEKQPEALRLAEAMEQRVIPRWVHATGETPRQSGFAPDAECQAAAAALRRLHAECEALLSCVEQWRDLYRRAFSEACWATDSSNLFVIASEARALDAARAAKEQNK